MNPRTIVASSLVIASAAVVTAQENAIAVSNRTYAPDWTSLDARPAPAWFSKARFGIFIHWGVYSVPAWGPKGTYAEWYWHAMQDKRGATWKFHERVYGKDFTYESFAPLFRAELFDPAQWADVFARSGARYVVLTSKHHEGFCLWPSQEANRGWGRPWNSVDVGPKRDLLGDLTKAVRARGLKMGFYYSLYEWYNPTYRRDFAKFRDEHFIPQFKDVVTRYKPSIIFADGEWDHSSAEWKSPELLAWLYSDSGCGSELIVNDRWGKDCRGKHGGYYTTEYGSGFRRISHPWEENRGIGASFGFNRNENYDEYRTAPQLIRLLIGMASLGGNLLLDIGPAADGTIPVIMQDRLIDMGKWLKTNGEAIYETSMSPYRRHPFDGGCTVKGNTLYLLIFTWPDSGVALPGLKGSVLTVEPLDKAVRGIRHDLKMQGKSQTLILSRPQNPDPIATAVAVRLDSPPMIDADMVGGGPIRQNDDGTVLLKAADATIHGHTAQFEAGDSHDNIGFWTTPQDWISWDLDVHQPGTFVVRITYACDRGTGGSTYVLVVGEQQVQGKIRETGSWTTYATDDLGTLTLEQTGRTTLSVKPRKMSGTAVMNLRTIQLIPSKR